MLHGAASEAVQVGHDCKSRLMTLEMISRRDRRVIFDVWWRIKELED